jgi:acetyltransferase
VEQPWIKEIDINPLLVSPERLLALDARVVLHPPDRAPETLPRPAIRPYPTKYVVTWTTSGGETVTIRPIRPEDEPLMVRFHEGLSDRSVYFRYLHMMNLNTRVAHERLVRMCFIDYAREMALVADRVDPPTGEHEILAVGRLVRIHGTNDAEFALLVTDKFQGQGLGTELLRRLVQVGRDEKLDRIVASIDPENEDMQRVSKKTGFTVTFDMEEHLFKANLELGGS